MSLLSAVLFYGYHAHTFTAEFAQAYAKDLGHFFLGSMDVKHVDTVRELIDFSKTGFVVIHLTNVDGWSLPVTNALLKILEESPQGVTWFLSARYPFGMLPTLLSRCQKFDLNTYWTKDPNNDDPFAWFCFATHKEVEALRPWQSLWSEVCRVFLKPTVECILLYGEQIEKETLPLAYFVTWLEAWLIDLSSVYLGADVLFFRDQKQNIQSLLLSCWIDMSEVEKVHAHLMVLQRHTTHILLNNRLQVEVLLLQYRSIFHAHKVHHESNKV